MERLGFVCALTLVLACGCGDDSGSEDASNDGHDAGQQNNGDGDSTGDGDSAGDGDSTGDGDSAGDGDMASQDAGSGDASVADAGAGVDCMTACELMVEPGCENGPPSAALCAILCESILDGDNEECRTAFEEFLACLDPEVEVTCSDAGDLVTSRCQEENEALAPCLP